MINLLLKKALGFIGLNKIMIGLLIAVLSLSYLLKGSYENNGVQSVTIKTLEKNNGDLAEAHDKRVAEHKVLQEKRMARDDIGIEIDVDEYFFRHGLEGLKDENPNLNLDLGDDFWLLIEQGAIAGDKGLPVD